MEEVAKLDPEVVFWSIYSYQSKLTWKWIKDMFFASKWKLVVQLLPFSHQEHDLLTVEHISRVWCICYLTSLSWIYDFVSFSKTTAEWLLWYLWNQIKEVMYLPLALWKILRKGFTIFLSTTEFTYMSDIMMEVKLKHL